MFPLSRASCLCNMPMSFTPMPRLVPWRWPLCPRSLPSNPTLLHHPSIPCSLSIDTIACMHPRCHRILCAFTAPCGSYHFRSSVPPYFPDNRAPLPFMLLNPFVPLSPDMCVRLLSFRCCWKCQSCLTVRSHVYKPDC